MMAFSSNDFNYAKIQEVQENFMVTNTSSSDSDDVETADENAPKLKRSKNSREKNRK